MVFIVMIVVMIVVFNLKIVVMIAVKFDCFIYRERVFVM